MKAKNLFTPRVSADPNAERIRMMLDPEDYALITRGKHWNVIVTDQNTGKSWNVASAPCGLPRCYCDAVIVGEVAK